MLIKKLFLELFSFIPFDKSKVKLNTNILNTSHLKTPSIYQPLDHRHRMDYILIKSANNKRVGTLIYFPRDVSPPVKVFTGEWRISNP